MTNETLLLKVYDMKVYTNKFNFLTSKEKTQLKSERRHLYYE